MSEKYFYEKLQNKRSLEAQKQHQRIEQLESLWTVAHNHAEDFRKQTELNFTAPELQEIRAVVFELNKLQDDAIKRTEDAIQELAQICVDVDRVENCVIKLQLGKKNEM